ncbi:hypothetical protein QMO17_32905, partial [Klebsiella pneumoniae]|nr:hypothetical protein [Klebsiella pneumoniae]
WTSDGIVRQASFVSLRNDKPARQIVKENPLQGADVQERTDAASETVPKKRTSKSKNAAAPAEVAGVRVSHPDRIIDKKTGVRKIDLVHYYE